jgi:uncharacterized phiE125 gp8 family phage protein
MGLKRTVDPTATPVSLAEAKAHCRILHDDEDALVTALIGAAVSMVEDYCGRSLMEQTWRLTLDGFADRIVLPRGPVTSLSAFTYLDSEGAEQTVSPSTYKLDLDADPQAILREPSKTWPGFGDYAVPITLTYVAGYETVPGAITQAILMLVASWYSNRSAIMAGSGVTEMPYGTMALLQNHRAFAA